MAQPVVSCFYSTVRSLASADRSYGFLGTHGKRLAPDEQITIPGNLISGLAARGTGPEGNSRHFKALERAVSGFTDASGRVHAPSLAVLATPNVHLYDAGEVQTLMLRANNGALGVVEPCWGQYSSDG